MDSYSIIPPIVAIVVVFWKKEVILALFLAIISAEFISLLTSPQGSMWLTPIATIEQIVGVASEPGNSRILLFSLLVGALLAFIRDSGGVAATVNMLINRGIGKSKRQVGSLTMFTGVVVFIESNLSVLTAGILARGLFDKYKMSRARLAYIIDSTSAPVCILILLNGWGALVLGLLGNYDLAETPVSILWGTLPLNFYAIFTLLIVAYTIAKDKVHGPMREAEKLCETSSHELESAAPTKARFMLLPMSVMIFGMLAFMLWTGQGNLIQGSGTKSVLYSTFLACVVAYLLLIWHKRFTHHETVQIGFKGIGELLPVVTIVLLSLTLGASLKNLGTGVFVAGIVGDYLPLILVPPMLFVAGGIMSFTTGTSWGTFAILVPIGVPLIQTLGLPPSLVIAAILGGGVFGDHCSPISDTSAISSIAAGCDLLTHVKTQMPYALFAGALTFVAYVITSIIMIG